MIVAHLWHLGVHKHLWVHLTHHRRTHLGVKLSLLERLSHAVLRKLGRRILPLSHLLRLEEGHGVHVCRLVSEALVDWVGFLELALPSLVTSQRVVRRRVGLCELISLSSELASRAFITVV